MKIKKSKRIFCFLASIFLIFTTFVMCHCISFFKNNALGMCSIENSEKMIGVWVPFMSLSVGSPDETERKFKENFDNIILKSKEYKINNIFVHVRSHGDAMYPSRYFPWSHLLTGTQGNDPGFNPLEYMIEKTHENNMKFHAWINPFRIQLNQTPENISANNPYFKLKEKSEKYFIYSENGICYNPAYREVCELIVGGVKEIIENYNVDGIHFDDYFYPFEELMTLPNSLDYAYEESTKELNNEQWRAQNINNFIKEVYSAIKSHNPKIKFGISPSGVIKNCYKVGADVKTWLGEDGFIDYLCPQIYWSLDFDAMPFQKTATEWKKIHKNKKIPVYCGLALYKAGSEADNGTWLLKSDIITQEIQILDKLSYDGFILYSWQFLQHQQAEPELENLKKHLDKMPI